MELQWLIARCIGDLAYTIIRTDINLLWPPTCRQAIIFYNCGFYLSFFLSFFLAIFSAVGDWMSTILPHMMWRLSANLEYMPEMFCTQLAENVRRKNYAKIAICAPLHNFVALYLRNSSMYRQSEKILNSNTRPISPPRVLAI